MKSKYPYYLILLLVVGCNSKPVSYSEVVYDTLELDTIIILDGEIVPRDSTSAEKVNDPDDNADLSDDSGLHSEDTPAPLRDPANRQPQKTNRKEMYEQNTNIPEIKIKTSPLYVNNGITVLKSMVYLDYEDVTIVSCVIDPVIYDIRIEGLDAGQGVSIYEKSKEADMVLGSGFVESFYPLVPTGLLKINNEFIKYPSVEQDAYSGILIESDGELTFTDKYRLFKVDYNSGVQVGPIIFHRGKLQINEAELNTHAPYTRSFIGQLADGSIVFGITLERIHLYNLAMILRKYINMPEEIIELYNLAGGGSEGLSFKTPDNFYYFGNTKLEQASLVVFRRR